MFIVLNKGIAEKRTISKIDSIGIILDNGQCFNNKEELCPYTEERFDKIKAMEKEIARLKKEIFKELDINKRG